VSPEDTGPATRTGRSALPEAPRPVLTLLSRSSAGEVGIRADTRTGFRPWRWLVTALPDRPRWWLRPHSWPASPAPRSIPVVLRKTLGHMRAAGQSPRKGQAPPFGGTYNEVIAPLPAWIPPTAGSPESIWHRPRRGSVPPQSRDICAVLRHRYPNRVSQDPRPQLSPAVPGPPETRSR
jgi:hypothetical protein